MECSGEVILESGIGYISDKKKDRPTCILKQVDTFK